MFLTMEQQEELVNNNLAVKKVNNELGLVTYKYHRKVVYDYLWKKHPELLECRGHTYDLKTGELVLAAPRKSFCYLEDGNWKDKPLDTEVILFKKYNGFMASLSIHNDQIIVGSTGTTNSDYVQMARNVIFEKYNESDIIKNWEHGITYLFEIIHVDDPHIVHENEGSKYLGYRNNSTGHFVPRRSEEYSIFTTIDKALDLIKDCRHEGYMMYTSDLEEVCKLKSPYYIGKKKLMRMSKDIVSKMYEQPWLVKNLFDPMWHRMIELIVSNFTQEQWKSKSDQERRAIIELLW